MVFHISFTVMIHTVSIFLTLTLATWRFIMIKFHSQAVGLCTVPRCKMLLALAFGKTNKYGCSNTMLLFSYSILPDSP